MKDDLAYEVVDGERRYWIQRLEAQEDNCDVDEDTGHKSTGIEIVLQMSHTIAQEYIK